MNLNIENIKVDINKKKILNRINLSVESGQLIALLGPSGCGKTTLLKTIAGLISPTSGVISIDGKNINDVPPNKRGVVIVFQDLRLFPHMTVFENISFPMEINKLSKKIKNQKVEKLLDDVQLSGFQNKKIQELSGGEKQRVALARALAADPKILLLDEPFSGLNDSLRLEMCNLVKKLNKETNITTILVTHTKEDALWISDKIALMDEGRILQYDTPENIYYHPTTRKIANYFGKANFIYGEAKNGLFITPYSTIKADLENGFYEALIRPFAIILQAGEKYTVNNITFQGETAEISVETPSGIIHCQMSEIKRKKEGIEVGTKVNISIDNSIFEIEYYKR